jgi:hypothetical protein
MLGLLHSHADDALTLRHQQVVGLGELRIAQPIKRIIELDLQRAASCRPLSHAF